MRLGQAQAKQGKLRASAASFKQGITAVEAVGVSSGKLVDMLKKVEQQLRRCGTGVAAGGAGVGVSVGAAGSSDGGVGGGVRVATTSSGVPLPMVPLSRQLSDQGRSLLVEAVSAGAAAGGSAGGSVGDDGIIHRVINIKKFPQTRHIFDAGGGAITADGISHKHD
jgi:hypothetical protein